MRRAPSHGALVRAVSSSSPGGSPARRPVVALALSASVSSPSSASLSSPLSAAAASSPLRRRRTSSTAAAVSRRGALAVRASSSSSAVASPPPPAASSSGSMGGAGGDLGEVTAIHGPEELDATLAAYPDRLVVLMAKSAGCRPCKAFARKYQRVAALYPDAVFTVITGDESRETRAMMMAMKVRVTPTFFVYRDRALFKTTTGVNENNLKAALDEAAGGDGSGNAIAAAPTAAEGEAAAA